MATFSRSLGPCLVLVAAALLGGCSDGPFATRMSTRLELAEARARWERTSPPDYSFTMVRSCFCQWVGRVRVTVRGGQVSAMVPLDSVGGLGPYWSSGYTSIDSLFVVIGEALDRGDEARVSARFDPRHGFPTEVAIDWWVDAIDDEVSYTVSDVVFETLWVTHRQ